MPMLLVQLEERVDEDLLFGEIWVEIALYVTTEDDYRAAVRQALAASWEEWGGLDEWAAQFDADAEVRARVYSILPDTLLSEPVYEEIFHPHPLPGNPECPDCHGSGIVRAGDLLGQPALRPCALCKGRHDESTVSDIDAFLDAVASAVTEVAE